MRKFSCILLLSALPFLSMAQSGWLELYNQSIEDYNNYNLTAAKTNCSQALDIYTQSVATEDKNIAAILRQLALICYDEGNYEEGISFANKEKKVLENIQQTSDENYAITLYNLGLLYSANGQFEQAKQWLSQSQTLLLAYHTKDDLEVAEVEGNLAVVYYYLSDWEACAPLFESAIATMEQSDEQSPEYANILYTYGDFCLVSGRPKQAIAALLPIKEAYEQDGASEDLASLMVKIASAYEDSNQLPEAATNYQSAIDLFDNLSAQSHPDYVIALNNLSLLYQREGNLTEALKLMSGVVDQQAEAKDEAYYIALANLGNIHYINESYDSALVAYDEIIANYIFPSEIPLKPYFLATTGQALIFVDRGAYAEALLTCDNTLAKAIDDRSQIVPLLKAKATALSAMGQYEPAETTLKEAFALVPLNKLESSDISLRMASLYTILNRLNEAGALYEEIKPYYDDLSATAEMQYANFLGNYAAYLQASGDFNQAEAMLLKSIATKQRLFGAESPSYLSSYENLGILYLTTGKYSKSKEVLDEVYQLKSNTPETDDVAFAYTLTNLGLINRALGHFGEAEAYFLEALQKYENTLGTDHIYYANTSNELGTLYIKMGNTKAARMKIETALASFEKTHGKYHIDYISALENLASLNYMEGHVESSKLELEEALALDKEVLGVNHPLYSKTLHNLASTLEELGAYDEAATRYQEALTIYENTYGTDHPSYANTLYNLAVLKQELEQYDEAQTMFEQVVAQRSQLLNESHPDLAYSYYGLAAVKQKTEDYEGALADYRIVIQSYLSSIENYFPSLSEEEKSAFYAKIKPVFEAFQDFAVEYIYHARGDETTRHQVAADLYDLQLNTKALLLNASNKIRNTILASGDPQLVAKFNEWQNAKEDLVKALSLSKDELVKNNIDLGTLQAKSNTLEKDISKMSAVFAGEFDKQKIDWKTVQKQLGTDEAAIEILRIKKNTKNDSVYYAALVIKGTPDSYPALVVITDGLIMDTKSFKFYKNMIVYKMEDPKSYDQYWQAIDAQLGDIRTVYLSSDGVYNKVNVNTLYDTKSKTYVIDKYAINLLSNTKELTQSKPASQALKQNTAAVFGFPDYELGESDLTASAAATERGFESGISALPGTLEEINNIVHTLDQNFWKYDKYEAAEANEVNVKKISNPKLLHIATHGFFMTDMQIKPDANEGIQAQEARYNPLLRSGLLLAGASKTLHGETLPYDEDGILTAYEAMNLQLDETELVVMSACETGLGEVKNGEGVYGLQRSFIVAGADNLIMSLWKVNDETTQRLMSQFYENWLSGQSKKEAFRNSILKLKKDYTQPYYWGAFVILGN
ncbi:CHAT domain-containing protein [Reichenbachiella carrageenanivorans]|uniref:CHAT domain-containing protein n=1 Tax=Reichenbachiella carrageenanivorans TaxID=2979869 RepID=A0ABY6D8S3_9BACT|nr:CHAT domain-containing protein [Reichenbachiella carrageenanivorans]UXX80285.1 CHAT domain-containing protein [Reichenbachiella carrageenanivorans]